MTRLTSTRQRSVSRSVTGVAIVLLVFGSVQLGMAQTRVAADWRSLYEPDVHDGMPYRLMKPIDFDERARYPLIVSLHG